MVHLMSDANRDRFLTSGWNNILTVGLGLPTLVVGALVVFTSTFSDQAGFYSLVAIAAFY